MKEKIAHLMKSEGLSASRLAKILETQPSRISHILAGRNNPSSGMIQTILRRFPHINPDWLLLDSGEMYRHDYENIPLSTSSDSDDLPIDLFGDDGSDAAPTIPHSSEGGKQNSESKKGGATMQNLAQNSVPDFAQFEREGTSVERVIIFYSDNTFCCYNSRKK